MKLSRREFIQASVATAAVFELNPSLTRLIRTARAESQQPNFLIILTDDQDMASMPVMRKLMARPYGNWVTYTNTFANEARCCPSRAALLTGQYSHHHGVDGNGQWRYFDDTNTLATWMHDSGYKTGFIGKYFIGWPKTRMSPGWDKWQLSGGTVDKQVSMAGAFIDANGKGPAPFFLLLSLYAPHHVAKPGRYANHEPYVPPDPPNYAEEDVSDKPAIIRKQVWDAEIEAVWRDERKNSQRELMMIDDGIQVLLDKLHAAGVLENTVVIFTADNGFSWGSHRYIYKHLPYEECSRVPTMIRWPGLGENREESHLVSNVDIAATIIDAAGVRPGRQLDGRSLVGLKGNPSGYWHEAVLLQRGRGKVVERFKGIRVPGWMYAEYNNGDRELYDLVSDPYELSNVVKNPVYAERCSRLRTLMNDLYQGVPRPESSPAIAGAEAPYRRKRLSRSRRLLVKSNTF